MSGAPFGLRRHDGRLAPDPGAAAIVREVAEAFVAGGGRLKTAAATLNAKGLRTRQGAAWSDTAVARALRVVCEHRLVAGPLLERCAALLEMRSTPSGAPERRSVHPLGSVVHCICGGRMYLLGTGAAGKFVCRACRAKVASSTLEKVFEESLASIEITAAEISAAFSGDARLAELTRRLGGRPVPISIVWRALDDADRRQLVDVAVSRILVDHDQVTVVFALEPETTGVSADSAPIALPSSYGSRPRKQTATCQGNGSTAPMTVAPVATAAAVDPAPPSPAEPKAYRIRHVAELLSLPKSTVYDMVRTGALPSVRTGGQRGGVVLVPASAVDEFLERRKRRKS
jgi:excisionase family DNA binding protein